MAVTTADILFGLLAGLFVLSIIWAQCVHAKRRRDRSRLHLDPKSALYGFFHPYCDGGGGGERVLWVAIKAIQDKWPTAVCVIYTWDRAGSSEDIIAKVKNQFNIDIHSNTLAFEVLKRWSWLEASRYRIFTLLGQSLGSIIVGWEAMQLTLPDVFIDTVGFAFVYPLAKYVFRCKVIAYVHYPTISSDMLGKVKLRRADFNNTTTVTRSAILSTGKIWYYRLFALFYGIFGRTADVVMVNSSWTLGHINEIWNIPERTSIVYPPCNTASLQAFPLEGREKWIVSIAQFRPEKAHGLQLTAFHDLLKQYPRYREDGSKARLILIGSSRNAEDENRVKNLIHQAHSSGIEEQVEIVENAKHEELLKFLRRGSIGLHTMQDEHFGIGIVEYMAAGLIPIAHNSGGPKLDIVTRQGDHRTGYLATTVAEYAQAMDEALQLSSADQIELRRCAREHVVDRFSDQSFSTRFIGCLQYVLVEDRGVSQNSVE